MTLLDALRAAAQAVKDNPNSYDLAVAENNARWDCVEGGVDDEDAERVLAEVYGYEL